MLTINVKFQNSFIPLFKSFILYCDLFEWLWMTRHISKWCDECHLSLWSYVLSMNLSRRKHRCQLLNAYKVVTFLCILIDDITFLQIMNSNKCWLFVFTFYKCTSNDFWTFKTQHLFYVWLSISACFTACYNEMKMKNSTYEKFLIFWGFW